MQKLMLLVKDNETGKLAKGDLLPVDKANDLQALKDLGRLNAFTGNGVNDEPVIALSDVGMAMRSVGSDIAIETAEIIVQTNHTSKIATSIKIVKATK